MLVKVSKKFSGILGVFDKNTGTVRTKTSASAPFEYDDALAAKSIAEGVLIPADEEEAEIPDKTPVDVPDKGEAAPDDIPGENPEGDSSEESSEEDSEEASEDDAADDVSEYEDMTYNDLRKVAKEAGINTVGMTKGEIIEQLRAQDAPQIEASEPV